MEGEAEEENDDVDEWDAKSWDDSAVNLSLKHGFSDEEIDSKPEPVVKKTHKECRCQANKTATSDAAPKESEDNLRSPICCIMGHVDTGKTKLLDCIRGTNVQEGEAGGITQQIGATYFPAENIRERTKELRADVKLKVPGLLVIDTPGHESFTNLQSRGSGLCDIAVLVVDIMHGLEPQTIESLNLLKMRNTKFIVALNKVDRLYGWKTCRNAPIEKAMKQQSKDVKIQFETQLVQIITQFKEQGLNTELNNMDKKMRETYRIVPTSAISGEGIPDLLLVLAKLTEKTMVENLTYRNEVQCTVLEVKVIEGLGTTIDVVLVNGVLHEGDQIVGPIVTSIRALLTPHPMNELRVKGTYQNHRAIKGAQGIKITAPGLEHAIAGAALYVVGPHDDLEEVKETAMGDMKSVLSRIDKSGEGVCVQAYTLGSLEALLEFLKTPEVNIPVSGISIGTVHKKDVMKASVMLEKKKEFATILAFDVKVTPEAWKLADDLGVKIFMADIIYHLFDQFKGYINNLKEEKKKESSDEAVFPSVIKILPNSVFNKKDPILLGVDVLEGILKVGTPICIPQRDFITIGRIASIKNNHRPVDIAKKGMKVSIKIIGTNPDEQQKMYGRHFGIEDELVSHITRRSIDALKANYRDELSNDEWKLVVKLKKLFEILHSSSDVIMYGKGEKNVQVLVTRQWICDSMLWVFNSSQI
ncbi:unnamed protein product [Prunus armeniaca]|uniref:Eukaryotic translation initiation factor 5B n=1 Tax=Prunus armeniaca TaxID=36596 RepID=A0A6J5U3T7_PRUAR|nr:unnamed protein product [Prunus armeniaca]